MAVAVQESSLQSFLREDNQFFNIKRFMARRGANFLFGQGVKVDSEEESIKKYLNDLFATNQFDDLLLQASEDAAFWGRSILTIDKPIKGDFIIGYISGKFFENVEKVEITPFKAEFLRKRVIGMKVFFINEIWDTMKVVRSITIQNGSPLFGAPDTAPREYDIQKDGELKENEYPEQLELPAVEYHNLGFVPFEDFTNKPARNILITSDIKILQDDYEVATMSNHINTQLRQWYAESIKGTSRIAGSFSEAEVNRLQTNNQNPFLADFIVSTNASPNQTKPIEVIAGTYDSRNWSDGVKAAINLYSIGCGYSPIFQETNDQTEAEALYSKDNDTRTTKGKRRRWQVMLSNLVAKILVYNKMATDLNSAKEKFTLEIEENVIYNKLQLTDFLISNIDNRLMTRAEAIAMARDLDDIQEAELIVKKINEEYDKEEKDNLSRETEALQNIGKKGGLGNLGNGKDADPKSEDKK